MLLNVSLNRVKMYFKHFVPWLIFISLWREGTGWKALVAGALPHCLPVIWLAIKANAFSLTDLFPEYLRNFGCGTMFKRWHFRFMNAYSEN